MSGSFTSHYKYPTLSQILFSPHLPYVPPRGSPLAMLVWKWRILLESMFGFLGMEPWEKYTVVTFLLFMTGCAVHCACLVASKMILLTFPGFKPTDSFPLHNATTLLPNSVGAVS